MKLSFLEQKRIVEDVFNSIVQPKWMLQEDLHIFHS